MMFNRTVAIPATTFTASVILTNVLPVNPISHLVLQYRFLNVTDEATLSEILTTLDNIEVLHNGQAITQINGLDLFRLNMHLFGNTPLVANQVATDNAARWITLIVPFGRKLYNPGFGIPATKAGQLQIRLTRSSSDAALDGQTMTVECVEMLGAQPAETLKTTTVTPAAPAVGDNSVDIPREGKLSGILVFATTVPTGTAFTKTVNSLRLLVDNKEQYITLGNWEALRGEHSWQMGQEKGAVTADGAPNDDNYLFIDLDPVGDGSYLLPTDGLNSLSWIMNAGDTNAWRFIPIRLVPSSRYAAT